MRIGRLEFGIWKGNLEDISEPLVEICPCYCVIVTIGSFMLPGYPTSVWLASLSIKLDFIE